MRWTVRVAAVALLLAGCGDDGARNAARSPAPAETAAAKQAPVLVFFQRQGAGGATLDTFTVRRDGSARLEKRYGGAGGRFKDLELRSGTLPELRKALAALPRSGSSLTQGSPLPGGAQYLLRYRGRTLVGRQGAIAARARPAVRLLDGLIDGIGVRRATHETATNNP